ncbi:L,D-transpeptidase [Streptomyces sp. ODS28]|uniref:L,D-transpeptidase family protein n=1 Tax=Streptomyces sp. ODS28 TaxID=3136688 RepID=UPI0031EDB6FB
MRARPVIRRRTLGTVGTAAGLAGLAAPVALGLGAAPAQAAAPASAAKAAAPASCTAEAGPYQKQAEKYLGLRADGKQSAKDCAKIRDFQTTHGIAPNAGYAGPVTWKAMKAEKADRARGAASSCPTDKGRIACVDLTRQVSWIQDGKKRVYAPPVPVRTGRDGNETRTGLHKIYLRNKDQVSSLYHQPMPYSQFFDGGIAFHSIPGNIYGPPGSHGCVNMRPADAKAYWKLLHKGDAVFVYGNKPGT